MSEPVTVALGTAFIVALLVAGGVWLWVLARGLNLVARRHAGPGGRRLTAAAAVLFAAVAAGVAGEFLFFDPGPHANHAQLAAARRTRTVWIAGSLLLLCAVPALTASGLRGAWRDLEHDDPPRPD